MFEYRGKTALVTGASSGIGSEFCRELAGRGMNLILVARDATRLQALANELKQKNSVAVTVVVADLSQQSGVAEVISSTHAQNLNVDLLVNNAGVMTHGAFEQIDSQVEQAAVMVNVNALVALSHAYLPGMLDRLQGGVINVASVAGFQPVPYLSVYAATKAFVINFSVGLWEECRARGVTVTCLCPGTTKTELFDRASAPEAALGTPRTVQQVVQTGLKGLEGGKSLVTDGVKNSLLTLGPRLIPRWFAAMCAGKEVKPAALKKVSRSR